MKKFGLLSTSAISSAALFGFSLAFAAPAQAQDTPECTPDQAAAGNCTMPTAATSSNETILVTGTRIRRPNLEFDGSDHLDQRRGSFPAGRHQRR